MRLDHIPHCLLYTILSAGRSSIFTFLVVVVLLGVHGVLVDCAPVVGGHRADNCDLGRLRNGRGSVIPDLSTVAAAFPGPENSIYSRPLIQRIKLCHKKRMKEVGGAGGAGGAHINLGRTTSLSIFARKRTSHAAILSLSQSLPG